ncbi:hypothetical protein LWI29_024782 [Acer saccharum]|uniref:Uncharacterized protein n=1 Tax=Acer saccharum TaxID=4024 RepID=A0AA39T2Q9_ACESA|nr:hypothetical protein LWI29_024782 [Acer saccharum]KAK1584091.1 hypothetical protein Q3G72_029700 [Acer saccharum]
MKPNLMTANSSYYSLPPIQSISCKYQIPLLRISSNSLTRFLSFTKKQQHSLLLPIRCSSTPTKPHNHNSTELSNPTSENSVPEVDSETNFNVEIATATVPSYLPPPKLSLSDQAFYLLAFIACTTSVAFTSLVIAAVPTLFAMGRAATSLSKLADTAREELPSTMAAIRLSGMEISDLTLELSDLSQEIADGVNKSAQAVQAAEAGIRQIGTLARQQTISMIQERASLPIISMKPVVAGAAKKTSHAVGQATKSFMNMISRGESSSENEDDYGIDRVEI